MIFKYEDEKAEYPTEEIEKLKEGETIGIDFSGKYLVEFEKTGTGTLVSTGRGMDGYGRPIKVEGVKVAIIMDEEEIEANIYTKKSTKERRKTKHSHPH